MGRVTELMLPERTKLCFYFVHFLFSSHTSICIWVRVTWWSHTGLDVMLQLTHQTMPWAFYWKTYSDYLLCRVYSMCCCIYCCIISLSSLLVLPPHHSALAFLLHHLFFCFISFYSHYCIKSLHSSLMLFVQSQSPFILFLFNAAQNCFDSFFDIIQKLNKT